MSAAPDTVLAIDFGTANTYYCNCPIGSTSASPIRFTPSRDGLATVVLYQDGKEPLVGQEAIDEWADALPEERAAMRLKTHFKPDIATNLAARQHAIDFLTTVVARWSRGHVDLRPANKQVWFGVPGDAPPEFVQAIRSVATEAGYGSVNTLPEPIGAMLAHLRASDLSPAEAARGILVVDFGGGTCDFAYMTRLQVRNHWGDMHLGGRLFDDLFFQWFAEQNPERAEDLESTGAGAFVRWVLCPEVKERFSTSMERNRTETFRRNLEGYGRLTDLTWDGFIERAHRYVPSAAVHEFFGANDAGTASPLPATPIDLIAWFEDSLRTGLRQHQITPDQVSRVILAGGSSAWPFVVDVVRSALQLSDEQLVRSDRPYASVAEGIAVLPALKVQLEATKEELRGRLSSFRGEELRPLIDTRIRDAVDRIVTTAAHELMDVRLRPLLVDFQKTGGRLVDLKQRMLGIATDYEPQLRTLVERETTPLNDTLPLEIAELVASWFQRHGLRYDPNQHGAPPAKASGIADGLAARAAPTNVIDGAADAVLGPLALVVGSISTTIIASLCGGGGIALIMTGPIGIVIGILVGIAITLLAIVMGAKKAREYVESVDLSAKIVGLMLTKSRIDNVSKKGRESLHAQLQARLQEQLREPCERIEQEVSLQVQREIEALDALCRL